MDKKTRNIAGLVAIIAVIALLVAHGSLSTLAVGVSNGVKLLGMQSVAIAYNASGNAAGHGVNTYPGAWWIALATVGGLENINVQTSALAFSPNTSYVCGGACQQDNLQIIGTYNKLYYPLVSQGTPLDMDSIQYFHNGAAQLTFNSCLVSYIPSQTTAYTNTVQLFDGCAVPAVGYVSAQSYLTACANAGGVGLVSGTYDVGCYQLDALPVGYVYQLNAPQVKEGVSVTFNGKTETVSTNNTYNSSQSNMAVYYFNYVPGALNGGLPSQSQAVVLVITNQSLASSLKKSNNTALLEGEVLQSQVSSLNSQISGEFPQAGTLSQAQQDLLAYQTGEYGLFRNNTANGEFKNATLAGPTADPTFAIINDPNFQYATAEVQILIQAASLGLYLGTSTFTITSAQMSNFRSGYTTPLTVTVKNTGNSQGGFTLGVTPNQNTMSVSPSGSAAVSGSLAAGSSSSYQFTIGDNQQNIAANSSVSQSATVTVCNIAGQCVSIPVSFNVLNPCNNNQPFNAGNCTTLTSISTTTICLSGPCTTSTTTIPCNPSLGSCGSSCPAFQQWDTSIVPNQCDYPLWEIIVAALALIAVFYYAIARGKGKGRTAKRTIRLGKNTQYMIFALIVIGILYYIGYLSWLLFAAVILGALYIVVKYIHIL